MAAQEIEETIQALLAPGKGILAADESTGSIKKRLEKAGIADTTENHRKYRQLFFTTPGIEKFISGVIMFDETIRQKVDDGILFPRLLQKRGIIPGIKVDEGKEALPGHPGEKVTKGLEGLAERLKEYKELGARFAKWRAVFIISSSTPSEELVEKNSYGLAVYAKACQDEGIVPIVEPEVSMDGDHSIERCGEVTKNVLASVFSDLERQKVDWRGMILKVNMILPGEDHERKVKPKEVATATLRVLSRKVPDEVPGMMFLSGGQTPEDSTANLDAINRAVERWGVPWELSFSFGRALQEPSLMAWKGEDGNVEVAQKEFYKRARLNGLARQGKYASKLEDE